MIVKKHTSIAVVTLLAWLAAFYFLVPSFPQTAAGKAWGAIIQGRVVSQYGPVENARVRVAGEERYTLTDRQGRFMLRSSHTQRARPKVTAGKEGWFNNERIRNSSGEIFLHPVYLNDQPGYRFISPVTCSQCHVTLTRYWDKSKMAHTTSNPKVLDMYYGTDAFKRQGIGPGYKIDNPRSNGNCATCHAPSVAASGPWSQGLGTALRSSQAEWDGISCDYCHKIRKVYQDKTKPSGMTAVLERQTAPGSSSILVFGPYDDVVNPAMAAAYNPVFEQGRFCSTCHSHYKRLEKGTPWDYSKVYSAAEWKGFGFEGDNYLPIQTTYQEWRQWQDQLTFDDPNKGKKCQDCHMGWRKEMLPYDNYIIDGMARRMWGTYRKAQNIHPHHFDGGTETQLKTALAMELEGEIKGKRLEVGVYITNTNGGHWVPTGETMRSVMLVVQAFDSEGRPLKMIKGSSLPEWTGKGEFGDGNYAGVPGAVFARVLHDDEGNIHVPFWRATGIASDTRIRPKTTRTLRFEFALEDADDEPTAEARVIYRPVIRPWAEKKNWPVRDITIINKVW